MLNLKKSSVAPYKVDMMLFVHDDYDVVCSAPRIIVITHHKQHYIKCAYATNLTSTDCFPTFLDLLFHEQYVSSAS